MFSVGITGGIGSGKSTVCGIFSRLGIPVFNADQESKNLLDSDPALRKLIRQNFGKSIYKASGAVDRKKLAAIVFADPARLNLLNSLVHPAVKRRFSAWVSEQTNVPYVIKEAAILFESGSWKDVDHVVTVLSPRELRISRVMQRDGIARSLVEERMSHQMSEEEKVKRSGSVIYNDEKKMVLPQVLKLHREFFARAARRGK